MRNQFKYTNRKWRAIWHRIAKIFLLDINSATGSKKGICLELAFTCHYEIRDHMMKLGFSFNKYKRGGYLYKPCGPGADPNRALLCCLIADMGQEEFEGLLQ